MTIAIGNVLTMTVLWTQQYIIEAVQINQDFKIYLYTQIGLSIFAFLLLLPIPFMRIFDVEPIWLRKLDQIRVDEKENGNIKSRPRRVSVAVDLEQVIKVDKIQT